MPGEAIATWTDLRCGLGYGASLRKRALDLGLALILSVILAPVLLGLAVLLLLVQGAPILHLSERMKAPGQSFRLVKFRTMRPGPGGCGLPGGHTAARITPLGAVLRKTRLDELPQLWNILRGDISFVGPRPPIRDMVERFPETYAAVLRSKPGVTGLASLLYHRHEERLLAPCTTAPQADRIYTRACVPRKARLDLIYQRNASAGFDLALIWCTGLLALTRKGGSNRARFGRFLGSSKPAGGKKARGIQVTSTILLTGGAGYIGSHTYLALVAAGHSVVIVDHFGNARDDLPDRLARITGAPVTCIRGDVRDAALLDDVFARHPIDAVVHFAALKSVGESMARPLAYLENNLGGLLVLLAAMERAGCRRLVFSSSATVYGVPRETPIPETAPRRAMNPYGKSKVLAEEALEELAAHDPSWQFGILRYFNPAGAHGSALIGEDPRDIPANLMPFVARVAQGDLPEVQVFGADYETPDGTGVRDYIHVEDLARGHVLSLGALLAGQGGHTVNLGTGRGYSVLELIETYAEVSGRPIPHRIVDRRPGDVPVLCAKTDLATRLLGFRTERSLAEMCASSWAWINLGARG